MALDWIVTPDTAFTDPNANDEQRLLHQRALELLQTCDSGPQQRASMLRALEEALEDRNRLVFTLKLLHQVRTLTQEAEEGVSFRVVRVPIQTATIDESLDLVLVPSIFEPEDWGFTFLEGLLRRSLDEFVAKRLIELGTGSGWVSLALLKASRLESIMALDLNPIALQVAKINAYLNSYDPHGLPRYDEDRKLLHERIEFFESDLLSEPIAQNVRADLVVGCIPQVLAPSPDLDPEEALSHGDEEALYDLSNYFVLQGVYEDQFGLGLLAKALVQSVTILAPGGRVILNIAGRPGNAVIERMFSRRGFEAQVVWRTRVEQAADTDIATLGALEERTKNPFEFFMGHHSREPIGAQTAQALRESGRPIWHDLKVYEASLHFEQEVKPFYQAMSELGYESFVDQLDLSKISEEQVSFLRQLAESFRHSKLAPYTHESGDPRLREGIASYLREYFDLPLQSDDVFLGPCRESIVELVLFSLLEPHDRVLLSSTLTSIYGRVFENLDMKPLVSNSDLSEIQSLSEALDPKVLLIELGADERRNVGALSRLFETSSEKGRVIIVDGSADFDITSELHSNPLLETISQLPRARRPLVVIGLNQNKVYPDLQPAFLIDSQSALGEAPIAFAESTYSRVSTFIELYYRHLFEGILSFQLKRRKIQRTNTSASFTPPSSYDLSPTMKRMLSWPAFDTVPEVPSSSPSSQEPLIRLDYGENELPIPDRLVQGILLGFTNLSEPHQENDDEGGLRLTARIAAYHRSVFSQSYVSEQIQLGPGVFPLIADLARALVRDRGRPLRVGIPQGHYGYIPPVFEYAGCEVVVIPTERRTQYLMTREALENVSPLDIVFLNNPTNPLGLFYPESRLREVAQFSIDNDVLIFSDEIFRDLDLSGQKDRAPGLNDLELPGLDSRTFIFQGISKSFAAGGVRMGWVAHSDGDLLGRLLLGRIHLEDRPARIATDVLLRGFENDDETPRDLGLYLERMREELRQRRDALVQCLRDHQITVPEGRAGGLFIFPDMSPLFGRKHRDQVLDDQNLPVLLKHEYGLQVNPGQWAAVGGHVRMCFSLESTRFDRGLRRLRRFLEALI